MSTYKILPSQVLIVPGYTNEEIIAMSANVNKSNASAKKNGTASKDKTKNKQKDQKKDDGSSTDDKTDDKKKNQPTSPNKQQQKGKKNMVNTRKTKTPKKTPKASDKQKKTSKDGKANKKKKVDESSGATANKSAIKVEKPKALLFSPNSVDFSTHRPDYEEFNSADGLILIEKACDQFAELQLTLSVHQAMRIQENGVLELSKDDKRNIDIITSGAPTALDPETGLGHFIEPSEFTDSYIEIRRGFFDNYKKRPLTLISDLFPIIGVCYITDLNYNINEGEEQAEYSITFREVDNTWG